MSTTIAKNTQKGPYKQATDLEHIRTRPAMYIGNINIIFSEWEYVYNTEKKWIERVNYEKRNKATNRESGIQISPGALKCYDEILVNAIDQFTKFGSDIWIVVDLVTYEIQITNNKSAIDVYETATRDGRKMYSVQMIFGEFKAGSNLGDEGDSITGGVFGIGAKATNAFSTGFSVETIDCKTGKVYYQEWRDCMNQVDVPEIDAIELGEKDMVRISFTLNWTDFQMNPSTKKDLMDQFIKMCYMRAMHTAAFCQTAKVHWNGVQVLPNNPRDLARLYLMPNYAADPKSLQTVAFELVNLKGRRWSVVLGVKCNDESLEAISIINGVYVKKGTHINYLVDQICEYVKPLWQELKDPNAKPSRAKAAKPAASKSKPAGKAKVKEVKETGPRFDKRFVLKYMFLLMTGHMNRPGFTGQRKDEIDSAQTEYVGYTIPEERLKDYWAILKPLLEFDLFTKAADQEKKKRRVVKAKKYRRAKWAGTDRAMETGLMIPEGDSADGTLDKIIGHLKAHHRYGSFSIGGVPMNSRKEITVKTHPKTGENVIVRSSALQENERLTSLVDVLNLDYTKKYETLEERETLMYGFVVIATDQDQDGIGNIRSQLFNFFWTFWPALIRAGFVRFLITPIIRAYHKKGRKTVEEFYTEKDYKTWIEKTADSHDYKIIYYKGLGSHGQAEIRHMSKSFERNIITYTADKKTEMACEVYFGKDTGLRKIVLKNPPKKTEEEYYVTVGSTRTLSGTHHFNTETKGYQIYNTGRHLKHAIDNFLPSRRKVFAGSRKVFGGKRVDRMKVFQLGGEVAKRMNYHHGDMSLNNNITHMTQDYPGACEFPFLLPLSNSGSRKKGGLDAGSPRYIYTKYNHKLGDAMFPRIDDYILLYTFDDGQRGEPLFYVPVVPISILEHYKSPGHGWACTTWARDYWEVSRTVRESITAGAPPTNRTTDFGFTKHRFQHKIELVNGVENSVGLYRRDGDKIIITGMPVRMWNEHFINGNPDDKKSTGVADFPEVTDMPIDESTDTEIYIEIPFKRGFLDELMARPTKAGGPDPVIKYLDLKQSLLSGLNMIDTNGAVAEFTYYWEVFNMWYAIRREYYQKRIARMSIILRLKIKMLAEQFKFVKVRETLKISGKRIAEQNKILEDTDFIKIDKTLLENPNYTRIEDLDRLIMGGPGAAHTYLRKMDADDLSVEGVEKLETEMKKLEAELADMTAPNALNTIWLKELDELDRIVMQGQTRGWLSWEIKAKFAGDDDEPTAPGADIEILDDIEDSGSEIDDL